MNDKQVNDKQEYIIALGAYGFARPGFVCFDLTDAESIPSLENARKTPDPSRAHRFIEKADAESMALDMFEGVAAPVFLHTYSPDSGRLGEPERIIATKTYTPVDGILTKDAHRRKVKGEKIQGIDADQLVGVVFEDCDFSAAKMDNTSFGCHFINCVFTNCNFEETCIYGVFFERCEFDDLNAKECEWEGRASSCDFGCSDFTNARLADFDFDGCELGGVEWEGANIVLTRSMIRALGL